MNLKTVAMIFTVSAMSITKIYAQQEQKFQSGSEKYDNQPAYFTSVKEKIMIDKNEFNKLFSLKGGEKTTLISTKEFVITGKVKQVVNNNPQSTSIQLEDSKDPSVIYTISKVTLENGQTKYVGNGKSFNHSDCLIIESKDNESFFWIKKKLSELIQD